jgi:alpha-beta hydrolase superfamily lysophospholipase
VHFLDRRGSGGDAEARGDVDHWHTWIEDVAIYVRQLRESVAGPVALIGISWGGKLAAAVSRRHPKLLDALGLICPGLFSPFEPGLLKRLALRAPLPKSLQQRPVDIPLNDPALFTATPEWQTFIAEDQMTLRTITIRTAREDRALTYYARHAAPHLQMPLLVMLAGRDRIIDNDRVHRFFRQAASADKRLLKFETATHTLEFEPDPQPYFDALAAWLLRTAGR